MSAPALKPRALPTGHIHLPSVHVRSKDGGGFDYEEDLYVIGRGRRRQVRRVVTLVAFAGGEVLIARETSDVLCAGDVESLGDALPDLMDEGNPDVEAAMQERGRMEYSRQLRIYAGEERACACCGCSETRACSGGCIWATAVLCSRCA